MLTAECWAQLELALQATAHGSMVLSYDIHVQRCQKNRLWKLTIEALTEIYMWVSRGLIESTLRVLLV